MRSVFVLLLFCLTASPLMWVSAQDLDVSEIVAARDAHAAAPTQSTRDKLMTALQDYQGDATVESVNAYINLLLFDGRGTRHRDLRESSAAALAHFAPVSEIIPQQYLQARFLSALSWFNVEQDADAMLEMAHVEGHARTFRDTSGERPPWADALTYKADAWGMAMEAYFLSARKRFPGDDEIDAILAGYNADSPSLNARARQSSEEYALPFCSGEMVQKPAMRYRMTDVRKGRFGAVILGFELDQEGRVVNPVVLASVPEEHFDDRSMRIVGKWRFKPDDPDAVGVTCRLNRSNVIQPLLFSLG